MAARLKLVQIPAGDELLFDRICNLLSDGVPRTYQELSNELDVSYASVYNAIRKYEDSGKTPLMKRSFARSNRHYVFPKKFATKLGSVWNTDAINKPITFKVLLAFRRNG